MVTIERHRDLSGHECEAIFSDDKERRFMVTWRWADTPILTACLLNPAMLEAHQNDHTGAGIVARARRWGFGGARIVNLFSIRTADPEVMKAHPDPVGPDNEIYQLQALRHAKQEGGPFVCGWGKHGAFQARDGHLVYLARERVDVPLMAFKINGDGSPTHPARLSYDLRLVPFLNV